MKRFWLFALFLAGAMLALNASAFADEGSTTSTDTMEDVNAAIGNLSNKVNALEKKGLNVEIHGFEETDMINDSTQSFNETVANSAVKLPGTYAGDNGWTQFSIRNSRISLLATGAEVMGWKTKGYFEGDFLGYDPGPGYGASPSAPTASDNNEYKFYTQPTFRLRHAYLDAQNDGWEILVGQWWSLFGWNMDYTLASVSVAPDMGTLYERTPQLRVMKTIGDDKGAQVQIAVDAEKPEQNISEMPNLNAGVRFLLNDIKGSYAPATGAAKMVPLSIGLSETNANYVWAYNFGNNQNFNYQNEWGSAIAADILIPFLPVGEDKDDFSVVGTGEWSYGAGDTDGFNGGGFSGLTGLTTPGSSFSTYQANLDPGVAGLTSTGQFQLVLLQNVTGQIQVAFPKSIGTRVTFGYGEIFSPNDGGLTKTPGYSGKSVYNDDSNMFVNIMQDFTPNIRAGLEYARYDTHYVNSTTATSAGVDAIDHRIQLSTWYRF